MDDAHKEERCPAEIGSFFDLAVVSYFSVPPCSTHQQSTAVAG